MTARLLALPEEILLQILSYLSPSELATLQLVCHALLNLARDNNLWRYRSFDESAFLNRWEYWQALIHPIDESDDEAGSANSGTQAPEPRGPALLTTRERERVRLLANWDPVFPDERVSWYHEYIQRHGPVVVNWLQNPYPHHIEGDGHDRSLLWRTTTPDEVRGLGLYYPNAEPLDAVMVVSPLEDGSICFWDVSHYASREEKRRGKIVTRSRKGVLMVDPKGLNPGVTECVGVDSWRHRAFFAVQKHLVEVDLQQLEIVDHGEFPSLITALSTADAAVPLTVGTTDGIYLHDWRARTKHGSVSDEVIDLFDRDATNNPSITHRRTLTLPVAKLPPCLDGTRQGPLSILHLQQSDQDTTPSHDIYVAGRFTSILHYDRRMFPALRGTIHSGARLCSLSSLPYPFSALDSEVRRRGEYTLEQIEANRAAIAASHGRTLIAAGEYNTKGSLELYGLRSHPDGDINTLGALHNSVHKNRQTCSQSKLLSVVTHGTRIAFSDGSGDIKWFERDGFTEVRRVHIGSSDREDPAAPDAASDSETEPDRHPPSRSHSLFAPFQSPGANDEIGRKLLPTLPPRHSSCFDSKYGHNPVNNDDLLFWTGDKLGLVTFSSVPGFHADEFEEIVLDEEALAREREEREYVGAMRRALRRHADDVWFVRGLGLGG